MDTFTLWKTVLLIGAGSLLQGAKDTGIGENTGPGHRTSRQQGNSIHVAWAGSVAGQDRKGCVG